ncbi:MAG: hypothetical protein AAF572_17965 [Cyanobacteria bacterium P01_B01_bin.77]
MPPAVTLPQPAHSYPPDVLEIQASMCQVAQPGIPQPIARWILEEGQLLGVLVASFPSPLFQKTISPCS